MVVIEDLISTGKSSLNAVNALKEANLHVKGMLAIFSYGFEEAQNNFKKANVELHTLSDYNYLLEVAQKTNYINQSEAEILQKWREDPENWKK